MKAGNPMDVYIKEANAAGRKKTFPTIFTTQHLFSFRSLSHSAVMQLGSVFSIFCFNPTHYDKAPKKMLFAFTMCLSVVYDDTELVYKGDLIEAFELNNDIFYWKLFSSLTLKW